MEQAAEGAGELPLPYRLGCRGVEYPVDVSLKGMPYEADKVGEVNPGPPLPARAQGASEAEPGQQE